MRLGRKIIVTSLGLGILSVGHFAYATDYNLDPYHSSVSFRVKHVIGKVTGHFDKFTGMFSYDEGKLSNGSASPTITFKSTGITEVQGNKAKLHGDLTMHGVTKPVVLDLDIAGAVKDPMGKGTRAGITATGHVNRADFGIGATTGPMAGAVGTDIEITIDAEGVSK